MASNPDWQDPNREVSPSQISQRVFNNGDDAIRVDVVTPLPLEATIDLAEVVIKDPDTDQKANVITGQHGLSGLVVITEQIPRSKVTVFGQTVIAPGATVLVATYTVPALKKFFWRGVVVGGGQEGEFDLQISTATQFFIRNSGSIRTVILTFPEDPEASAAATIDVYITNIGDLAKSFEATICGYTVDA